jgi:hypothetical protein
LRPCGALVGKGHRGALPPSEWEIAYCLPSPDGTGVLDRQLRLDYPDAIESVGPLRSRESLAKLSLFRLRQSLVDETQMRTERIVGRDRVAVPCRLEHSLRRGRFDELKEKCLGEAVGAVQPIDAKLDRRKPGRHCDGGSPSLRLIRSAAKERDVRFELDRVEVRSKPTDERAKRRLKRFVGDEPEREPCVSDFKFPLLDVLLRVDRLAGQRSQ